MSWGIACAVGAALAFSLRPVLIKLAYAAHPVSPVTLLFLRMALSLPFFIAVAWWLRGAQPRLTPRDRGAVTALGFIGYYLASFLDFIGLQYVGAGVGRLILFLYPTLVLILSFLFLHKRPTGRQLLALGITYAGVALVVASQAQGGAQARLFVLGAGLVFASALFYAVYLVAGGELVQRIGSMRFTAYSMVVSAIPAIVQFPLLEPASALALPPAVWLYVLVMATVCTVLPLFLAAEALKRIGATNFGLIGALGPVSAALMGAAGLDEPLTAAQAAGGVLVIVGVLLVTLKRS